MPSNELAEISIDTEAPVGTLRLAGVLGVENAEDLRRAALTLLESGKEICIDWSSAVQIDASVLQVVLALGHGLAAAGRSLSIAPPAGEIASYLRIAGFSSILDGDFAA